MAIETIEEFWTLADNQSSLWQEHMSTYTDEMEPIIQAAYDKDGELGIQKLTPVSVAQQIFKPERLLTIEEVVWAVRSHWEDDFLNPNKD